MRFNNPLALVKELKDKIDLVDFIGRDIEDLQQRGTRWIGRCPFHDDANPSFGIMPLKAGTPRQWGCHACALRGDLIDYVQRRDSCSWHEAIVTIVDVTGYDVSNYLRPLTDAETLQDGWYREIYRVAQAFHQTLLRHPAELFYLEEERDLARETIERFLLGFSPSLDYALTQFGPDVLRVLEPNEGNWNNIFGGNILIPQYTAAGQIWGFFARRRNAKPKYVGPSGSAPLNDSSGRLYGFSHAKKLAAREKREIVIVEGFFDAMKTQEAGFPAIATCTTALSDDHIKTLNAHSIGKATVIYDGDNAGTNGMLKIALGAHNIDGLQLKFGRISGDPDEYISERGVDAFGLIVQQALRSVEFVIAHYARAGFETVTAEHDFYDHCISYLSTLPRNSFNRESGIKLLADELDTSVDGILDDLDKLVALPMASQIAEVSILSEFVMNSAAFSAYPQLKNIHFTIHSHRTLFEVMLRLYQSGAIINIDLLLYEVQVNKMGTAMEELIKSLPLKDRSNVDRFVLELIDRASRRQMHTLFDRAKADIFDLKSLLSTSVSTVVESVTQALTGESSRKTVYTGVEAMTLALQTFEQRQASDHVMVGLDLGPEWSRFMSWTGGLRGGRTYLIAAPSGVGKSVLLTNWVHRLSMAMDSINANGLISSMEMSTQEYIDRLIAIDAQVPYDHISRGRVSDPMELARITDSFRRLRAAPLTWMTGQKTVPEIAVQARLLHAKGKLDYIAIDYIQLLSLTNYPNSMSTTEKYNAVSQELKDLAEILDVPIIIAAQLNRDGYEKAEPSGKDIGSSIKIYQDCHCCYILVNHGEEDSMLGILDKNRDGASKQHTYLKRSYETGRATLRVWEGGDAS